MYGTIRAVQARISVRVAKAFVTATAAGFGLCSVKAMLQRNGVQAQSQSGRPVVIAGPSGVGKGTLIAMLLKEYPKFKLSVSHTTRKPRPGEEHGVHYNYVTKEEFEQGIKDGKFIEYNNYNGNFYGTSTDAVKTIQKNGKICVLDVDINGCKSLKKTDLNCRYVFISPGDENPMAILESRLRGRATDDEVAIQRRLERAKEEMTYKDIPGFFDFVIVNDDKDKAYVKLKDYLKQDLV